MSLKPIAYYGCDYEHPLINDIADFFGYYLHDLPDCDRVWLISKISAQHLQKNHPNTPIKDETQEILDRLEELPDQQITALIQALAN
jgi:hypothetical protein